MEQSSLCTLSNQNIVQICRICYQEDLPLIIVCSCAGTLAYVHESCIKKWINYTLKNKKYKHIPKCQLCLTTYFAEIIKEHTQMCYYTLLRKICRLSGRELLKSLVFIVGFILALFFGYQFTVLLIKIGIYGIIWSDQSFLQLSIGILKGVIAKILYPLYFLRATIAHLQKRKKLWQSSRIFKFEIRMYPTFIINRREK